MSVSFSPQIYPPLYAQTATGNDRPQTFNCRPVMALPKAQPGRYAPQPTPDASVAEKPHINLAVVEMMKIALAVLTLRMAFHMVPKGLSLFVKLAERQGKLNAENRLLQWLENRAGRFKAFMKTLNPEHASSLYKSLMAIIDGLLMLYVGGEIDRYYSRKNKKFKPPETKDPEKVVDKVLLVLIATERIENLMHHLFHWLDRHPGSGRQFLYGELAALTAVLFDTSVKVASDRYKVNKNKNKPTEPGGAPIKPFQTPGGAIALNGRSNAPGWVR